MLLWRLVFASGCVGLLDLVAAGCLVQDEIEFQDFESVILSALAWSNGTIFEATVNCEDEHIVRDTVSFTKDTVTWMRIENDGILHQNNHSSPGTAEGWIDFTLSAGSEGYQFTDSLGHTWISEGDTEGCHANKVTLSKGQLMYECSEGAPVWQVSGGKCVEVPVPRLEPTWMVHFTLLSSKAFIPSFTVGGIQLVLGWLDGGLAVVAGDGAEPLPSHKHHCLTIEISSNEKTTLKVLANGRMDQTLTLSAAPNIILACGNLPGVFTLQQHKDSSDCGNISFPSTQGPVTDAPDSTLLMVGTSTIASAVAGILVCLCCAIRRRGQDTRGNSLPPSTSPPEPLPVFPPRLTPFLQQESRANYPMPLPPLRLQEPLPIIPFEQQCPLSGPGSDEDEIYHEMITLATTKPPPGSYVHEETEETINDIYVSADMLTD